uniref:CAB/ELIP/HLIP superfamily protein n=1 Tax=Pulvinaster venetus TaxID=427767 RepID=UPI001FCDE268|nr:CAB/ELIP/HLIP superfamily protein [Pulvinaster venetus]UNJ16890.1 CAB/ELIP/HLIP superfamily protein [Pulvinaster venetus]
MFKKNRNEWNWGFTSSAENWNGRISMISFMIILIIELIFQQNILNMLKIL